MAEVDAGAYVARSGVTVAAHLDDWLTTVEPRLGRTTWNSYRIAAGRITSALGATLVQSLTPLEDGRVGRLPRRATGSGLVGPDPTAQSRLGGGAHQRRRSRRVVNVAWDGGDHAFLLDTKRRGEWHRRGVGTELVGRAAQGAKAAGCEWLHVDFEPHLRSFYIDACGFRPTDAGLIRLHSLA